MSTTYLTAAQVAERHHITRRAVYKRRAAGRGPKSFRVEGRLLFDLRDVEEYERARKAAA
jgi:hypothetical protein